MKQILYLILAIGVLSCQNNSKAYEQTFEEDYIDSIQVEISPSDSFKPFKMGILKVDTMIVHKSLEHLMDSIELGFEDSYFKSIKQSEEMITFYEESDYMKEDAEESIQSHKEQIEYLKTNKEEILNTPYYDVLSSYSVQLYRLYFYASIRGTLVEETQNETNATPIQLMDDLGLDYLLIYENIYTESISSELVMKLKSKLYSAKAGKVIVIKNTEARNVSHGGMWTCDNELTCLMLSSIRESLDVISMEIRKRQVE